VAKEVALDAISNAAERFTGKNPKPLLEVLLPADEAEGNLKVISDGLRASSLAAYWLLHEHLLRSCFERSNNTHTIFFAHNLGYGICRVTF
jgi:hypothetical protein